MNFLKKFASKLLGLDDTYLPISQIEALADFLGKQKFDVASDNLDLALLDLKRKHLVDSVLVANNDGSLIASSESNGASIEAINSAALLSYIKAEMPKSETIFIKRDKDWFMLIPFNSKVYIVKASAELSNIELRALTKELDSIVSGLKYGNSAAKEKVVRRI